MTISLPDVRYHTVNSPYHYTEDNKPLQDLAARDLVLKAAVEDAAANNITAIAAGNWTGLTVPLDLHNDMGKAFAYRIRIWAIQDQNIAVSQCATLMEDVIFGHNNLPGTVVIDSTFNHFSIQSGAPVLTQTYTPSGNNINVTFSGYTGTGGYVLIKAERFGT
jgi:hypothetical protein